jgi:hypothetical protein
MKKVSILLLVAVSAIACQKENPLAQVNAIPVPGTCCSYQAGATPPNMQGTYAMSYLLTAAYAFPNLKGVQPIIPGCDFRLDDRKCL